MKAIKFLTIISAIFLICFSCEVKSYQPEQDVSFSVSAPLTKSINDGLSATLLYAKVFDADHNLISSGTYTRGDSGWEVQFRLVPGVYSFTFFACSPEADAFEFEDEYMTLSYSLMDMNSDTEDAYWASLADFKVTTSISRTVTLKRPFAFIQLSSDTFIDMNLNNATSSFIITGAMSTKLNLITGESSDAVRKAIYSEAKVSDYTIGRHPVPAMAYVLVPEEGVIAAEVSYKITLADGKYSEGKVNDVPLQRNYKTTLKDY